MRIVVIVVTDKGSKSKTQNWETALKIILIFKKEAKKYLLWNFFIHSSQSTGFGRGKFFLVLQKLWEIYF